LVLTASQAVALDLQSVLHIPAERVVVILAAAERSFEPQTPAQIDAVRARLGLPEHYVLSVGTNKPHKNLVRLVEAWARIQPQPFSLVLAGLWDVRYPESRQRVAALGLERAVRFLGPVPEADLPALYSGAALVVLPSEREGFGLPAIEAMACGTPVACANVPSVCEVVRDAAALFDPRNVDAIAAVLAEVLADRAGRADLAERGRRRSAELSWEDCARATLAAYRRALA
jgi:alpha-1,3-rhamnosyl/mannosyltransferase